MINNKILRAKYRGITFNFRDTGRTGGRKTVFHTYPNSDIVLAEDLGRSPVTISITIIVTGDETTYFSNKQSIITALESKGASILEHPTYGQLKVQIDGDYSINERIFDLGYAEISATFKIVDNKKFFAADQNTNSFIQNKRDQIAKYIGDTFMSQIWTKAQTSYTVLKEHTTTALNTADNVTSNIFDTAAKYNEYKANLVTTATYYPSKISSLNSTVIDIFDSISNNVSNPTDQFNFYKNYFTFLDSASSYTLTSRDNYFAQNNQDAYKAFVQSTALAYAVNSAANIDFDTEDDQKTAVDSISDQFEKVSKLKYISPSQDIARLDLSTQFSSSFSATSPDIIYDELQGQKVAFTDIMKQKSTTLPKITTVDIVNENLSTLVYRYYGNLDNYNLIKDLNSLEETSYLTGTYKIITT